MNILVTGAAGFIAPHLIAKVSPTNKVYALLHDRRNMSVWHNDIEYLAGDITGYGRMLEIIVDCEIDQVYHYAAKSIVRNTRSDPLGCFHANIMGTATILEAARQSGRVSGIMCMESDKAYGDGPVPYEESQALRPGGVYETSKACVSHLVSAYHKNYGLSVFSIRAANTYGPGDRQLSRLIPRTITRLLAGERPEITCGASFNLREFIFVEDLVDCTIRLMAACPWGEVFNVGSGSLYSVAEAIEMICELMGEPFVTNLWDKPDYLTEIPTQSLCGRKLQGLLSCSRPFAPRDLRDGLKETIEWYRTEFPTGAIS